MPLSKMPGWVILPITLPAFTITGMWIVYAMALSNNHICPVSNWVYNHTCESLSDGTCCTLDHIPLVSKCGNLPPESCFFSLICSLGAFMVMLIGLIRYAYVIERYGPSLLNTVAFVLGWICAAGLTMVGSFQVDHAKVLHYIGAGVAFPTSMMFIFFQSILTYRMAHANWYCWTGHLRCILTLFGLVILVLTETSITTAGLLSWEQANQISDYNELTCGVLFIQEGFVLQHIAALCEWTFIINVLVFYGTFAFEFGAISTDTFLVLLKASRAPKSYKAGTSTPATPHAHSTSENMAMI